MTPTAELRLIDSLQRALGDQQLHMVYQPKISLRDGGLRQVEALVRWEDPELGTVKPSHFVPLAEQHGLIDELTNWGLRRILRQWLDWNEEGLDTCIAFNISALSLQHLDFPDLVERMCRALEVPTDRLVLELTEGATQPLVKLMDALTRFRIKGIGLAIDDFGTGYSSMSLMKQFPIDTIKIDRSFVRDLPKDTEDQAIAQAIISMGKALGMTVVAEGVENYEQHSFLRDHACDEMQGYLFSKPLPPEQLAEMLRSAPLMNSPPLQPATSDPSEQSALLSRLRSASV